MGCSGTCRVEQFEWRLPDYEGPSIKPGDSDEEDEEVDANTPDEDL